MIPENFFPEGINIKTNWGNINEWSQPIINQPEIDIWASLQRIQRSSTFYYKPKSSLEM